MGAVLTVLWQAIISPATTIFILVMVGIWIQFLFGEWDSRYFSQCYSDCVRKKQLWRTLLAPLSHASVVHLLLDTITLWSIRFIEQKYGTFFFARYSIVMAICESVLSYWLIGAAIRYAPVQRGVVSQILTTLHCYGCSGIILGWLAFFSMDATHTKDPVNAFVVLGLFAVHPVLAPLIMIAVYYICLSKNNLFSNLAGLCSGYLLKSGVLQIMPDLFWSVSILVDIGLVVAGSIFLHSIQQNQQGIHGTHQRSAISTSMGLASISSDGVGDITDGIAIGDTLAVVAIGSYSGANTVGDIEAEAVERASRADDDIEAGYITNPRTGGDAGGGDGNAIDLVIPRSSPNDGDEEKEAAGELEGGASSRAAEIVPLLSRSNSSGRSSQRRHHRAQPPSQHQDQHPPVATALPATQNDP